MDTASGMTVARHTLILRGAAWALVACYMGGIWYLSSQGAEVTSKVDAAGISDFWAHMVLYGGLSGLLFVAFWTTWPQQPWGWLIVGAAAWAFGYGLIDELHQSFNPARGTDLQDLQGNLMGAVSAQALCGLVVAVWRLVHTGGRLPETADDE